MNKVIDKGFRSCRFVSTIVKHPVCLKQIFLNTKKLGGPKKDLGVTAPEFPTVPAGLGRTVARKSSLGTFIFVQGG